MRVALFRLWCTTRISLQGYCCGGATGGKCCMETKDSGDSQLATIEGSSVLFDSSKFIPLDPTQELIFPPALKVVMAPHSFYKLAPIPLLSCARK